jgi:ureidoglycolate hydrolase
MCQQSQTTSYQEQTEKHPLTSKKKVPIPGKTSLTITIHKGDLSNQQGD